MPRRVTTCPRKMVNTINVVGRKCIQSSVNIGTALSVLPTAAKEQF